MESLKKKIKDGGKIPRRFTTGNPVEVPNQPIRVWIVSKPQPDGGELVGMEDSPKSKEGRSSDVNDSEGKETLCGTYISKLSRDIDFLTSNDIFEEEFIQVNSKVLSLGSNLFQKLFNDMKAASEEGPLTIVIEASEKSTFVRLLEFIYDSIPPPPSYEENVDLLMISDEFQALSCAQSCISQLVHTLNSAFSCFELSRKVHWDKVRDSLAEAAMDYVTNIRLAKENGDGDIERIKNELLQLPFSGIESVFSMDDLTVESEEVVYDFILFWALTNYPKPEDHSAAKELHLERLVRFPYLRLQRLEEALRCCFFDLESISKAVVEALAFKVREPYCRRVDSGLCSSSQFVERFYKRTPVMVTRRLLLDDDQHDICVVVLFDLTEKELLEMFEREDERETEDFQLGHHLFSVAVSYKKAESECYFLLRIVAKSEMLEQSVYTVRFMTVTQKDGEVQPFWIVAERETYNLAEEDVGVYLAIRATWPLNGPCYYVVGGFLHLSVEISRQR